jgi:hypothetical protein
MRKNVGILVWIFGLGLAMGLAACASGGGGSSTDRNRITAEELASVDVSTLYEVVQRLRPRWLDVRSPRGIGGVDTQVVVFLDRTFVGGVNELRQMGADMAVWLQYRTGSDVAGELFVPGDRHVEGAIIVHTREERR